MSATEYFVFWQAAALLLPLAALAVGLAWTGPNPDFSLPPPAASDPIEDLANPTRSVIWLNGLWEFKTARDNRSHRIELPRPWNTIKGLEYHTGECRYRRLFSVPEGWNRGCVFLNFRGVNYRSVVSIDGRQAGAHEGGFTPFSIDITDRIPDSSERELEVIVDNSFTDSTVPNVAGWNNDGGILREVYLETRNEIHIEDAYVYSLPDLKGRADIALMIKIHNPELKARDFRIEIFSPQGALVHSHEIEGWTMQTLQHRCQLNFASLWSPESPMLYRCRISVVEDNGDIFEQPFGIRTIEFGEGGLELNGKPVRIRAVNRVEESPLLGRTQSLAVIKSDLEKIKEAGFNAVRLGAFAAHGKTLELCDRMGLLVFEELPAWHTLVLDLGDPGYQQAAETQLREMISRDRNHPCIAMWGLGNSMEGGASETRWFVERLSGLARGLDDRLVYVATYDYRNAHYEDLVDCLMVNMSGRNVEELKREVDSAGFDRSTLLWHKGVPAHRPEGSRYPSMSGSEEQQAAFAQDFIDAFDEDENISGWLFGYLSDFRDPADFASATPFVSHNGITRLDRTEKLACRVIRRRLTEGRRTDIPINRRFVPITSFSKALAILFAIVAAFFFLTDPALYSKLAFDPEGFTAEFPRAWRVLLVVTLLSSVSLAVIINRYFRSVPSRVYGSIDMPFFVLISIAFRNEFTIFLCTYFAIIHLWVFATTLLSFAVGDAGFIELINLTAAMSLPELLFVIAAFLRVPFRYILIPFNIWKFALAWIALGPLGALVYTIAAPVIFVAIPLFAVETKYHILRYLRRRMK